MNSNDPLHCAEQEAYDREQRARGEDSQAPSRCRECGCNELCLCRAECQGCEFGPECGCNTLNHGGISSRGLIAAH